MNKICLFFGACILVTAFLMAVALAQEVLWVYVVFGFLLVFGGITKSFYG